MDIHACGARSTPFLLLIHVFLLHSEIYLKILNSKIFSTGYLGNSGQFLHFVGQLH